MLVTRGGEERVRATAAAAAAGGGPSAAPQTVDLLEEEDSEVPGGVDVPDNRWMWEKGADGDEDWMSLSDAWVLFFSMKPKVAVPSVAKLRTHRSFARIRASHASEQAALPHRAGFGVSDHGQKVLYACTPPGTWSATTAWAGGL